MSTSSVMLDNADLLVSATGIEQAWQDLNQAISDGDVIAAIAGISVLAASIPGPQQVGLSITSSGLTMTNALDKIKNGTMEPKDVLAVTGSVLTGLSALAALGIGATLVGSQLAAVSIAVGIYGLTANTEDANKILQDLGDWLSSGQYKDDLSQGLDSFSLVLGDFLGGFIDFALNFGDFINGIEDAVSGFFNRAKIWTWPRDPLILDLDGDGLETVGLSGSTAYFDFDGDGVLSKSGWVGRDDALLVWDKNNNGAIDTGAELFGDFTPLANGSLAPNGFAALAGLDANGDGVIDAADPAFAELKLWRDASQDGHSGQGELLTLAEAGIVSLNLANLLKNQTLANGCGRVAAQQRGTHRRTPCGCNTLAREGSFTRADGSTSAMGEFRLAIDTFDSQFAQAIEVPVASAQFGLFRSLCGNSIEGSAWIELTDKSGIKFKRIKNLRPPSDEFNNWTGRVAA